MQFDSALWYTPRNLTRGMMRTMELEIHTAELDSKVWCTPWSLTQWCDAHRRVFWEIWFTWLPHHRVWLVVCSVHHTVHTTLKMSNFVFTNLLRLSTTFYQKRSEIKKIPFKICDLQYNFHSIFVKTSQRNINCKILDQNTHLTSYWLRGVMHTAELDCRVWLMAWVGCRP